MNKKLKAWKEKFIYLNNIDYDTLFSIQFYVRIKLFH